MYKEPEVACTSNGCKDISGKMLDSIDHETDPCENFHEYSCGGVHNDEFLKPESAEENLDRILKEQLVVHDTNALKFYDSCLNFFDGTENLRHEKVFPQDWKVDPPKSEFTNWPSVHLTKLLAI
ncbi:hypothetical protein Avbf_15473 [Armadillidium vulgare]|nr:hypothetical protein Avbf_15473 [Armadillidium vulgare]